ncbi:MAG: bifunctional acetate--CoA ligase family protein/GNAT family N-acetyltransferase [Proteobacteria bacterium]|nr:GNAT family N-acetyltransferase [Desulfobacula sp.]MBU3952608.1 bifunctional acetate--CoA ligase family protein/GNAT family N-acetyltransferase [Pseudomonadota bacterium]MBU4131481.1 bifunctional acetate--CoA ligase family protein/GNAT family N-acetyltransferase [Pseudomonadota bacterium]
MTTLNLHHILNPRSVAVIGASEKKGSVGASIMTNLVSAGFKGKIFPVNPKYTRVMGMPALPSAQNLESDVDMAVIAVPMDKVPDLVSVCSEKKILGVVVISAGPIRSGDQENPIWNSIRQTVQDTGIRVIGPDSVGLINTRSGFNASFMHQQPLPGKIAFVSQSGAVCTAVLDLAMRENVGFSHFVNLGSKLDVDFADMIDYLGSLNEVESIVMYVESLKNIRKFMSAARAVSRVKPIIAMKSGRTGSGSDPGEDEIYDAIFQRAGILRVHGFDALFDCAKFLAKQKRPRGSRLAIVSNAGGIGVMAVDALANLGIKPADLTPSTITALDGLLGDRWRRTNPIEVLQETSPEKYIQVVKTCIQASEIDGLLLLSSPVGTYDSTALARPLVDLLKTTPFPVFTAWMGGLNSDKSRTIFNQNKIIAYETPERAVQAFVNLYQYGRNIEMLQEIPDKTDKRLNIQRPAALRAVKKALAQKEPCAFLARDLLAAYGIKVDPTKALATPDYELQISMENHPLFGPVLRFGMGGSMTQVVRDTALALPPLNRILAARALEATRISMVFQGYKQIQALDTSVLEEMLILISRLVTDFPGIRRLELNPIQVHKGRVTVTHARAVVEKTRIRSAGHLVISPYPWWQESEFVTRDKEKIFMRPVRPGDADQIIDFFSNLSPETVYLRFFSPIKRISKTMLIRLTQIDYDREIALVAFAGSDKKKIIVGVARIVFHPAGEKGEFALVLADNWQRRGVGTILFKRALVSARKYGLKQISGPVISTNTAMLALGQKLGFDVKRDVESSEYKLEINLKDLK